MSMSYVYAKLKKQKHESLAMQKRYVSENKLIEQLSDLANTKNFQQALQNKVLNQNIGVISEIKKAVPIKGIIRKYFNLNRIAKSYEEAGSIAISVITEENIYLGKKEHLKEVRFCTSLPLLRHDLIFDAYQVIESRVLGADAITLCLNILSLAEARSLEKIAHELQMDVVLEVHDMKELEKAFLLNSKIICINNRNPNSLEVNIDTSKTLSNYISKDYIVICKNGVENVDHIREIIDHNIYLLIVGEYVLNQPNIKNAIQILLRQA
jgi:indole-3-glycerol phosphate synthase